MSGYVTLLDFVALVKSEDFDAAFNGNEDAKLRIAESLDGVDLYFHAGPDLGEGYIGVTIADLISHGIIKRITLHKDG